MNFQQVEQGNGNLVQMFGTFTEIGGLQYTPQQKAKAICKIRDDTGAEHNVHIYQGKGQLPSLQQFSQRCQFNISTFQGTYKNKPYTGYSGFWDSSVQVNQQQPPQTVAGYAKLPPPPPQQPAKPTNNKDQLDVAQVVYKRFADKFTDIGEFDLWLMSNRAIFVRHISLIMMAGQGDVFDKAREVVDEYDAARTTDEPNF